MSPQPSAARRAPAPDPRARDIRTSAEKPAAEESLYAHAKRVLRARIGAAANAVFNPCIALLKRMRKGAGGAQDTETDEDRPRSRNDRPGVRHDAVVPPAEAEAETPKPRRRLRAFLVYLSVLLAGGIGGGTLAYDLLETLLDRQFAESRRLEAAVSEHAKSVATAQEKLKEAQAKGLESEKKLGETEKKLSETGKKLDETEKRLETMLAAERARNPPPAPPASRGSTGHETRPLKTGDCAMASGNIAALKNCIDNFNR